MQTIVIRTISILFLLIIVGCASVGPDYTPPQLLIPSEWNNKLAVDKMSPVQPGSYIDNWWTVFNDSQLSQLIDRAVRNNLDIMLAKSRLKETRARRGIVASGLFPSVDVSGNARRTHSSEAFGGGDESDSFSAGLDASWEVDIFGGRRRSVEAADADVDASLESLRDTLVSLSAEVALNYLDVRTTQALITATESNLKLQEDTYGLTSARYEAGISGGLDFEQATYTLETTRAQLPLLRIRLEQAMNRIAVLLGENPGSLHRELLPTSLVPVPSLKIFTSIPADTIRQRPDIRRSERELAAQTARIGVATAELYPKFTLSGSVGLNALTLGDLFNFDSSSQTLGAGFSWPVFRAGAIRKNIEVQSSLQEQSFLKYEAAVLTALEEMENALRSFSEDVVRQQHLKEAVQAARRAYDLVYISYSAGMIDFQSVIDSQRSLVSLEDQLAASEGKVSSDAVRIYKAMGGGWTYLEPSAARNNEGTEN